MSAAYLRRCAGKARHEQRAGADAQRGRLTEKFKLSGSAMNVYFCDQCLGWHVGGASNRYLTRRRRSGKRPNKRMRGRV